MSAAQNESRKRGKKRYAGGHHGKRWKGSRELEVGMEGILITCNMNERKCTAEAFNLLNEYADNLYGAEKVSKRSAPEEDVDVALKKEVAQLQASGKKQERRFQALDSGANNVIFIKTQNLESDKLVHHILSDLHTTKKKKSRVILRMLPVTGTCKAFQDDMVKYLTTYLDRGSKPQTVVLNSFNPEFHLFYDKCLVGKLNPKNKVDLTNPELTVIVEVIKAVCCISVVKDYTLYRKYNVQEVVKEDAPKPDVTTDKTDADKPEQTETETEKQKPKGEAGETNQEGKKGAEENDENVSQDNEETVKGQGDGD
uniref:THUMP domain containing 1 n=1 Tax=Scophthalmus maximus TaxID=52904 RepID=A0A8D3EG84_SCOMX